MLVIDIGNSVTKILAVKKDNAKRFKFNISNDIDIKKLEKLFAEHVNEEVYVSSVNSNSLAFIVNMSKKYNCLIHTLNSNIMKEFALKNNYQIDNIDILGSDLFADIVGSDYNGNQLIIDCGTATKFLIVDKNRKFYGGAISPGITMCSNMLDSNTDLLQSYNIVVPSNPYSLKTDEAVNAGAIYGTAFMAKSYIEFINKEFPNVKVTLTGGASAFLVQAMEKIWYNNFAHDPDHIIKGICRAFNIFREVYFK